MGLCRKPSYFNRLILSGILASFSLASIPTPVYSQVNVNLVDLQFAYDIEQICEKMLKAADKQDGNKTMDLMLEAKAKVENYTGTKINVHSF